MGEHIAGRELDALVAVRVMGGKLTAPIDPECDHSVGTNRDGSSARRNFWRSPTQDRDEVIPNFSSSMTDAWAVVERLRERGWTCAITTYGRDWVVQFGDDSGIEVSREEYPALAICLAALAATGEEGA